MKQTKDYQFAIELAVLCLLNIIFIALNYLFFTVQTYFKLATLSPIFQNS